VGRRIRLVAQCPRRVRFVAPVGLFFLPIQNVAFFTVDQADHPALNHHAVEADC